MAEVLVVGLSARALTQSARAAGYAPLSADLFRDLDTREAAAASVRIDSDLEEGLAWEPLMAALDEVAAGRSPAGVVCGSGFEDRPALLDRLAARWPLWGNASGAVGRVKDPARLAELCRGLGIPHPRWSEKAPDEGGEGWVSKRVGGAGGLHVTEGTAEASGRYWQQRVDGMQFSALVLSNGDDAMVLGLSTQWSDPSPRAPYRYGGAVRPAALPGDTAEALQRAATAVAKEAGLVGLNGIDFLVAAEGWHLIDVNPRPGATLDIFRPAAASLFALHVEACRGTLPTQAPVFESNAAAARIVYANRAVAAVPAFDWPQWAADRQPPGTALASGDPLCTVLAEAETPQEARRLVAERGDAIAARLGAM